VAEKEVTQLHPQVPDWSIIHEDGIPRLRRLFRFPNFERALGFSEAAGD